MGTQTDQLATSLAGDTKDCCSDGSPTYSEIQQMLIESQNFTIRLLCEKIDVLHQSPFGSSLNPQAEVFVPSAVAPQFAQACPASDTSQQAQEICLSELIPSEDSLAAGLVPPLCNSPGLSGALSAVPGNLSNELDLLATDTNEESDAGPAY